MPQDDDPPTRCVRILPLYLTAIGNIIFPGEDFHTIRMRSDFSEMLLHHLNGGGLLDLAAIGAALAEFTPERVSTTTHPAWKDMAALEWESERQLIFAAMEKFFLGGGLEKRLEDQRTLFVALQSAGIQFGNAAQLIDRVLHAGHWQKELIELAMMGRQYGIQLSGNNIDRSKVAAVLHSAGFSQEQRHQFWCSLYDGGMLVAGKSNRRGFTWQAKPSRLAKFFARLRRVF